MPITLYFTTEEGKYLETHTFKSDPEESQKQHKSVYDLPTGFYTKVKPLKPKDGYDQYFINGKWEYRIKENEESEK